MAPRLAPRAGALAVALALAAGPAAAVEALYVASARLDVRARSALPGGGTLPVGGDVELLPAIEGALLFGHLWRVSLGYSPSLLLRDLQGLGNVQNPATPVFLHRGRFNLTGNLGRTMVSFNEDAAYGELDVTGLRSPDGAPVGALPELTTLGVTPYLRTSTSVSISSQASRLFSWALSAGYVASGDPTALDSSYALVQALGGQPTVPVRTNQLPFQYGPVASASMRIRAHTFHTLVTSLSFSEAHFTHLDQEPRRVLPVPVAEQLVAQLIETWEGRLSHAVNATFSAGVAFTHERIANWQVGSIPGDYAELLPVVGGTISTRLPVTETQATINASLRLAPYADRFTGLVYERLEGRAQAEWRPVRVLTTSASVSAAYALGVLKNAQQGDLLLSGDVVAEWALSQWLSLAGLARALYTQQRSYIQQQGLTTGELVGQFQWMATMSVIVRYHDSTAW